MPIRSPGVRQAPISTPGSFFKATLDGKAFIEIVTLGFANH
jgi:hypothetical protein